jgi:hypothetical protein
MQAQMRQLGQISSHLAQQHFIQQQQAALGQLLFDTEQFAKSTEAWAKEDPFAAGFLANMRLRGTGEVRPEMFYAVEHKRAWLDVRERLEARWRTLEQNPSWRDLAFRLTRAVEKLIGLQAELGPDPQGRLADLRRRVADRDSGSKILLVLVALASVFALGSCGAGCILVTALHDRSGDVLGSVLAILFLFGAGGALAGYFSKAAESKRMRQEVARLEHHLGHWSAFQHDPEGGRLLDQMVADHPLIGRR